MASTTITRAVTGLLLIQPSVTSYQRKLSNARFLIKVFYKQDCVLNSL